MNILISKDKDQLARDAADFIVRTAAQAIADHGQFTLAVSGGSTPRKMLELLSQSTEVDWSKVHLFQVANESHRMAMMIATPRCWIKHC